MFSSVSYTPPTFRKHTFEYPCASLGPSVDLQQVLLEGCDAGLVLSHPGALSWGRAAACHVFSGEWRHGIQEVIVGIFFLRLRLGSATEFARKHPRGERVRGFGGTDGTEVVMCCAFFAPPPGNMATDLQALAGGCGRRAPGLSCQAAILP